MRTPVIATLLCTLAGTAFAGFPDPVAMDGPVKDVCASVTPKGGACKRVARRKVGGHRVVVVVENDWKVNKSDRSGNYYLAVELTDGWYVSHDPLSIVPNWREHGPDHEQYPRRPHLQPLALARPAIAIDVPVTMIIDDRNDQEAPPDQPPSRHRARGSPAELFACGERADGSWACLPPLSTGLPHAHPPRFRRDGSITGDFLGYDVTAADRVEF